MSKVEQEHQARQAEAERLNKKIEREGRDAKAAEQGRDAFSKLVRTNQQSQAEGKTKGERADKEAKQGEAQAQKGAKAASEGERAARLARGGAMQQSRVLEQARSFHGVLSNQQAQTQESDKARVERREAGTQTDRVEAEDRAKDVETKDTRKERDVEEARVESRAEAKQKEAARDAAVNPDGQSGNKGRDQGQGGQEGQGQQQQRPGANQVNQAQAAKAPHQVKQIPPEILEKLVSAVWLGVNDKGLREFQIELKDGPLKGAHVKITAEDGKIGLVFSNLDGDSKRLVEASKGDLMRRLEKKGLSLARLDVR